MILDGNRQLVGPAHDAQLDGSLRGIERREQVVGRRKNAIAGVRQDIAFTQPGLGRRAVVFHAAHEETVDLRQTNRTAQPACDVGRRDRDTETHALW
jgi:hypothetical protein